MTPVSNSAGLNSLLACPQCHSAVVIDDAGFACASCGTKGVINGRYVLAQETKESFFDERFETMQKGNTEDGTYSFCYEKQVEMARTLIAPTATVLDVGCGPTLAYKKLPGWQVIGIDPSLASLRVNQELDLGIFGTAEHIPLQNHSVDAIVCFYSIHHMVGLTKDENSQKVAKAFAEFSRVIKPGGMVLIFDMSPWRPFWALQKLAWNFARGVLGSKLDMFFWHKSALERLGATSMPGSQFKTLEFNTSPFITFPPAFALPWLKIPRFMYPLEATGYMWSKHSRQ